MAMALCRSDCVWFGGSELISWGIRSIAHVAYVLMNYPWEIFLKVLSGLGLSLLFFRRFLGIGI